MISSHLRVLCLHAVQFFIDVNLGAISRLESINVQSHGENSRGLELVCKVWGFLKRCSEVRIGLPIEPLKHHKLCFSSAFLAFDFGAQLKYGFVLHLLGKKCNFPWIALGSGIISGN